MSKYSSFKEHQLITENWRKFLNEGTEEESEGFFQKLKDTLVAISDFINKGLSPSPEYLASLELLRQKNPRLYEKTLNDISSASMPSAEINMYENAAPLREVDGPKHSLSRWAEMFPRAAAALDTAGEKLEAILQAIEDAQPERDSDPQSPPRPDEFDLGVFEEEQK